MERHVGGAPPPQSRGRAASGLEAAHASEYFEHFLNATTLKNILGYHRSMCELLHLKPNAFPQFYPKLRASLGTWKAKALWKKFDSRISHKCYGKGKACQGSRVLVIGAGPCGLRTAIEAQLLGAKVVVVEKRDRLSRNNVLHLWPFVIEDLRALGAKKFFGKFCAGAIDHISIRQLQCVLLKVALLLGVEIHTEVSFERLREPDVIEKTGWRAEVVPKDHPVAQYEFDVIVGADGKRNTLQGFKRKEFRGKLAIAITANFINKKSEAEARVEEISGVAFIFNQKFFKDLQAQTRIDLENIVYYKDDTHYFVMTAKKASLLEKGVIKRDLSDTAKLLAAENVDREALQEYARQAADFSTNYQLPELAFAVNHYGQPDVAMFDFTSMYAAEYASRVIERRGHRLLTILVGDSLLEPFWPTGSGCARGFLSSLDAAWAIRGYCSGQMTALDVLAERESIYRLLAQTTPDNLNKDWKAYTLDPATRYPNLNKSVVTPLQTVCLYDTDAPESIEKMKRASLDSLGRHDHVTKKRRRGNVDVTVLITWLREQLRAYDDVTVTDLISVFRPGKALCALLHHYRPDLVDYAAAVANNDPAARNQLAIEILEKELGVTPFVTGEELTNSDDFLTLTTFLTQVFDTFRGEIPHVKHPRLELPESQKRSEFSFKSIKTSSNVNNATSRPSSRHKRHADAPIAQKPASLDRKQRKRRTLDRVGPSVEERQRTLEQIEANRQDRQEKRQQRRRLQTERFAKSMQMLRANRKSDDDSEAPFEDYSIFLYRRTAPAFEDRVRVLEKQFAYVPDYDAKMGGLKPLTNTNADEDIASKIRSLEDKWSNRQPAEKKPRDLMRAIGKIETSDWNIKQIEKKILENKMGKPSTLNADKERVPRWSREEFKARQTKMEKKHLDRQDSTETKFADIDRNIRQLDLKLREGTNRELGGNRVAQITEKLVKDAPQNMEKPEKLVAPKPVNLPVRSGSEFCHFCSKRVYLMERLSAEGRFFHHGCFKCQYCHTQLRLGSYMFDRDGQFGYRFYCIHHFGMQGELPRPTKIARKPSQKGSRDVANSPQKRSHQLSGVAGLDLLDRVETPERVEFANLSSDHVSSDRDEPLSQMDEDEWTDKNFGASANELDDSDDDFSSSLSDSDSDEEDAFDDAMEQPMTREGTMKLAQMVRNTHRKSRDSGSDGYSSSDQSSYYENTSDDSDSETATEDEEEIRARELRRREVLVQAPTLPTDTETDDTEVRKKSKSTSSDDAFKSAESDSDLNRNLTFTAKTHPQNALNKSATSDNVATLTQRHILSRTSLPEVRLDQPLLVTRRPPNKVNLPNEIKPKVAVNARKFDANKYFGQSEAQNKTRNAKFQSNKLQNSPNKPQNQNLLSNQLQSTSDKSQNRNLLSGKLQSSPDNLRSFSFEVNDSDLNDVDVYIEQLLSNERELQKPAAESPLSSSVEDLLDCLQREPLQADQKAEELLRWIEELEHQNPNVERHQKGFARKLSDDSKRFFENVLNPRVLARSRTETQIAQKKMLDSTVDVKSVLRKFESEPQKTTFSPQKLKNHSDSAKCFSETRKNVLPRARSLDQPDPTQKGKEISSNRSSDLQKEFLAQNTQKTCLNQPLSAKTSFLAQKEPSSSLQKENLAQKTDFAQKTHLNQPISAKTPFLTQKEPFSSSQKENLAQKGDFGVEIGSNQSSDPQKNILAQKESFSSAQKENLAQKPKNQSDSVKSVSEAQKTNFSCPQKSDFDEVISTNQSSDPQKEFLAQKTQKTCLNQLVSAKTPFLAQKESSSSVQKENLAQKGDFGAEIGSNQSSDPQKNILAQKESSSSPQKENLAQKVTDSIKSFSEAQTTSFRAQKGDFAEEISSNQSSDPHKEFSAQKENSYAAKMDFLTANTSERAQKEASESKSLEETVEELEKFVDETIESIGKRKWCGNVAVTSECSEKAQKMGGHDFSKAIESDSDSEEEKRVAVTQKALSTKQVVSPKFSPKFPPKFGRKDQDKDCCVQ